MEYEGFLWKDSDVARVLKILVTNKARKKHKLKGGRKKPHVEGPDWGKGTMVAKRHPPNARM